VIEARQGRGGRRAKDKISVQSTDAGVRRLRRLISMNSRSARDKTADTGKNDAGDMASRVFSHAVAAARIAFLWAFQPSRSARRRVVLAQAKGHPQLRYLAHPTRCKPFLPADPFLHSPLYKAPDLLSCLPSHSSHARPHGSIMLQFCFATNLNLLSVAVMTSTPNKSPSSGLNTGFQQDATSTQSV
jgi:hypothetical protein